MPTVDRKTRSYLKSGLTQRIGREFAEDQMKSIETFTDSKYFLRAQLDWIAEEQNKWRFSMNKVLPLMMSGFVFFFFFFSACFLLIQKRTQTIPTSVC